MITSDRQPSTQFFCARMRGNLEPSGPCEDRKVFSKLPFALHGSEPMCPTCKRPIAATWGVHGDLLIGEDGEARVHPYDPRNRGLDGYIGGADE